MCSALINLREGTREREREREGEREREREREGEGEREREDNNFDRICTNFLHVGLRVLH